MKNFTAIHMEEELVDELKIINMQYTRVENQVLTRSGIIVFQKPDNEIVETQATADRTLVLPSTFIELKPEIDSLIDGPLVSVDRSAKLLLDKYSDYYKMKLKFDYIDLKVAMQEAVPKSENCTLRNIAKYYNISIRDYNKKQNYASLYAVIALKHGKFSDKAISKSIHLLRIEYYNLLKAIINIGKVDNKSAANLLHWIIENIDITEEHFEVYGALKNFYSDENINEREEIILLRMMRIEIKKIDGLLL